MSYQGELFLSPCAARRKIYNSSPAKSCIKRQAYSSQDYVEKKTFPAPPPIMEMFVLAGVGQQ